MSNKRFFGLHLDFHAGNITEIGTRTRIEDIEQYIKLTRPDFIQCDCKGHPGNSCYPTKVGKAADMLMADNLRPFAEAAKRNGIPLFVHYSGVYDVAYTKAHPEEAQLNENGECSGKASLFGNYVHDLLIPQLKELITEYGISGAWLDGECWAVERDYSKNAAPYLKEGMTVTEHNELMREAFRSYVKTYVDEIHAFSPDFLITSNWMYATHMPERPTVDIDFISGDYAPNNSTHKVRYDSRIVASQGKPWDLMAWSFEWSHFVDKPAEQLMQEAACVLSMGGGFQLYINQLPDGATRKMGMERLKRTADFVHARSMLFEKPTVSDTAVFLSTDSYYEKANIFNAEGANNCVIGALDAVLDSGLTASILIEYQLDRLSDYPVIIVPEWEKIKPEAISALIDYARSGGKLIVMGAATSRTFAEAAGITLGDTEKTARAFVMNEREEFASLTNRITSEQVELIDLLCGDGHLYANDDTRDASLPLRRSEKLGDGSITFIAFPLGSLYFSCKIRTLSDIVKDTVTSLITPTVTVNKRGIDITMQRDGDALLINLINMNQGRHSLEYPVYDEIPVIEGVTVRVKGEYSDVTMPLGESFELEVCGGDTLIKLDKLTIHSIISLK